MENLTIFGGKGFVGGQYVRDHYDAALGNIVSVNGREDYEVYSKDILYFIATVHNYHVFDNPHLDIDTNLSLLITVLENWRKRPDSKDGVMTFVSSWFVYGTQTNPYGVKETAVCDPRGFYGITKRCAEQLLISYCSTYGLKYRILRLSNVIGPGDTKVSAQKNALQYMVNQMLRDEDVGMYRGGNFYRDYIHVQDCSKAIDLCISKGTVNEIYNIGNGKTWMFKDIILYIARELRTASRIISIEPKDFHKLVQIPSFYMNIDKLKSLGYAPLYQGAKLYQTLIPQRRKDDSDKNTYSDCQCSL